MSERRQARSKVADSANTAIDPNHAWFKAFDHPTYGHVILRYQGDQLRRIKWTASDQGQNVHSRHSDPQKFADILRKLGISDRATNERNTQA